MPTPTTELGLQKGVDTDDTADYLTVSLANSLGTLDALFNNVSGHTHGGPHQGGPLGAGAIPPGSITSAMIVDGTIVAADIAANAVNQQLGLYLASPTFSTTPAVGVWVATPVSVGPVTCDGSLLRVEGFVTAQQSGTNPLMHIGLAVDGGMVATTGAIYSSVVIQTVAFTVYVQPASGPHTIDIRFNSQAAGCTLAIYSAVNSGLVVTEQKR
jgi:hypothetical protein